MILLKEEARANPTDLKDCGVVLYIDFRVGVVQDTSTARKKTH